MVEVAREPCRFQRPTHRDEADPLDHDHPWARVAELVVAAVSVEVLVFALAPLLNALHDPLLQHTGILGAWIEVHPHRSAPRVHEVVGARGADLRELRRICAAGELEHLR